MNRRRFLAGLGGAMSALCLGVPRSARAGLECTETDIDGLEVCTAGMDGTDGLDIRAVQQAGHWCWAACVQMLFRYQGYEITQAEIVQRVWGDLIDAPASPEMILRGLRRSWTDAQGHRFRTQPRSLEVTPEQAARELADGLPLLVGTRGHAMLLASVTYYRSASGMGEFLEAVVLDPWPGRGRRVLSEGEWHDMHFLARLDSEEMTAERLAATRFQEDRSVLIRGDGSLSSEVPASSTGRPRVLDARVQDIPDGVRPVVVVPGGADCPRVRGHLTLQITADGKMAALCE